MTRFFLAAATAITLGLPAFAGEQYIDGTGFAVSGYDVVAYRGLTSNAVGSQQTLGVAGQAGITAEYNDATFAFASEENRDKFLDNPEYYAPVYDGHCAYGVSKGGKVPGNPNLWRIVDDKLYLNITKVVVGFWEEDIPGNINLAEGNWPGIEGDDASGNKIPNFTSAAPD
ncbi:YHS domain-containing (seleno)protein [Parasedimentitalea psychrophila]|uniref:YHS domain-containing (Seleno)protein n=1 Tax=Parasedimentitalea psychrophila TaxID=2997337 RepID=A0A9Y2KYI8_9RHOB|nr:YHS domain-containing (seleno)protein [Parasedimentitalea psychrophila]WIY23509.1 YHS domain-containing (seleno)protein [Parasedimentitalea psychrophila]